MFDPAVASLILFGWLLVLVAPRYVMAVAASGGVATAIALLVALLHAQDGWQGARIVAAVWPMAFFAILLVFPVNRFLRRLWKKRPRFAD